MRARKAAPLDIIYDRYSPIVVYEVTPESIPNEGGMRGIKEPRAPKCWYDQCKVCDVRTILQEPACSSLK